MPMSNLKLMESEANGLFSFLKMDSDKIMSYAFLLSGWQKSWAASLGDNFPSLNDNYSMIISIIITQNSMITSFIMTLYTIMILPLSQVFLHRCRWKTKHLPKPVPTYCLLEVTFQFINQTKITIKAMACKVWRISQWGDGRRVGQVPSWQGAGILYLYLYLYFQGTGLSYLYLYF